MTSSLQPAPAVIWHDVECGAYAADLPIWRELAAAHGDPILDVGAGTGRVTLDLARAGHRIVALDRDPVLLAELSARAAELPVSTITADARTFSLAERFQLCVVPMQTIQLLGGSGGRRAFLRAARRQLAPMGRIAIAIAEALEPFEIEPGEPGPLPDLREVAGTVYLSVPVAIRARAGGWELERRREVTSPAGEHLVEENRIVLDRVSAAQLEQEARAEGLRAFPRVRIRPTPDHVGSTVVVLGE